MPRMPWQATHCPVTMAAWARLVSASEARDWFSLGQGFCEKCTASAAISSSGMLRMSESIGSFWRADFEFTNLPIEVRLMLTQITGIVVSGGTPFSP